MPVGSGEKLWGVWSSLLLDSGSEIALGVVVIWIVGGAQNIWSRVDCVDLFLESGSLLGCVIVFLLRCLEVGGW